MKMMFLFEPGLQYMTCHINTADDGADQSIF